MNNTSLTTEEMIQEICKLKHLQVSISDCSSFLLCSTEGSFLGIKIEKISFVEETEDVYRIIKEDDVVTIFKKVNCIHITLF